MDIERKVKQVKKSKQIKITGTKGQGFILPGKSEEEKMIQKEIYLGGKKRRFPAWVLPLFLSLLAILLILWLLPKIFASPEENNADTSSALTGKRADSKLQIGQTVLVSVGEMPLYKEADERSIRLSTAFFAEKMTILDTADRGFFKVELADGFVAWAKDEYLSADLSIFDRDGLKGKAMVLNPYKRVMSHARDGYALFNAPMGTILFADYVGQDVLRLRLPDDVSAWVSTGGLKLFSGDFVPDESSASLFASSAMNFHRSPYLPGGISKNGADLAGAIYISARVNGLALPRDLASQAEAGVEVETITDINTGLIRPNLLETGDVLFFHSEEDKNNISHAAIILEEGQALTRLVNDSVLSIRNLNKEEELLARLVTVRRYFP